MGVARDIIVRELAASRHTRPEYPDTEYPTQAISSDAVRKAVVAGARNGRYHPALVGHDLTGE
jgi:hypothetical protein